MKLHLLMLLLFFFTINAMEKKPLLQTISGDETTFSETRFFQLKKLIYERNVQEVELWLEDNAQFIQQIAQQDKQLLQSTINAAFEAKAVTIKQEKRIKKFGITKMSLGALLLVYQSLYALTEYWSFKNQNPHCYQDETVIQSKVMGYIPNFLTGASGFYLFFDGYFDCVTDHSKNAEDIQSKINDTFFPLTDFQIKEQ